MKQTTAIGIAFTAVAAMLAVILEGGNPMAFINIPAFSVVIGGTLGVCMAGQGFEKTKAIPKLFIIAVKGETPDVRAMISKMVGVAEKARRDGLLALESDLKDIDDEYARQGLQLVVDGADSEVVQGMMESELANMEKRHAASENVWRIAGGFGPTLGILGTVMSLVHVLENLDDPGGLGHAIAGAFIATLYGVGSANVFYFPVANRLKELSAEEAHYREMVMEAVLAVQAGENPRLLNERLQTYLPPGERGEEAGAKATGSAGASDASPAEATA